MSVEDETQAPSVASGIRAIPRSIIALGFVSLFMDISSEIIHSLLPVFLVSVLVPALYGRRHPSPWRPPPRSASMLP